MTTYTKNHKRVPHMFTNPHRRYNALTDKWILVSPQRTQRPWQGRHKPTAAIKLSAYGPHSPLCPGNQRKECEADAAFFKVDKLRDVAPETFEKRAHKLEPTIRQRARHVISESHRTIKAAAAFDIGGLTMVGHLMQASHQSLRDDFQVSCPELDKLCEIAISTQGVYGARMTGAGFGGCLVALVEASAIDRFLHRIHNECPSGTSRQTEAHICRPSAGVSGLKKITGKGDKI